jgi:hypothetical protein
LHGMKAVDRLMLYVGDQRGNGGGGGVAPVAAAAAAVAAAARVATVAPHRALPRQL